MPAYEIMREAVKDPDTGEWVPTLVWAWRKGETIQVRAIPSPYHLQSDYERRLEDARLRGFKEPAIWLYWAGQGGNGYTEIRTRAEPLEAPSMDILPRREIRKFLKPLV